MPAEHLTPDQLLSQQRTRELRQVLTDLALVSHVRGTSYDSSGGGGARSDKSGTEPPGGVDRRGDKSGSYRQKSHLVFLRRLDGLAKSLDRFTIDEAEAIRDEILDEAVACLRDWRKTPEVPGQDPDRGTYEWKVRVANDPRPSRAVAGFYGISHVSVLRYRKDYLGL